MDKNLAALAISYVCIFTSVYVIYDLFERTLHDILGISPKTFGALDMLYGTKMPGVALFTTLADVTRRHRSIAAFNILCYPLFCWLYCAVAASGAYLKLLTYLNTACLIFFSSGVFPLIDAIALDYLERTGNVDHGYARMKIFEIFGQLLASVLYIATYGRAPGFLHKKEPLLISAVAGILGAISLYFVPATQGQSRKHPEPVTNYLAQVGRIVCSSYFFVLLTVFMEGVARRGSSSYGSAYMEANRFERVHVRCMHLVRSAFSIFNFLFIRRWRRRLGYFSMLCVGSLCGFLRSLLFFLVGVCEPSWLLAVLIFVGTEITKGFLSVFFLFSVASISNNYADAENRALLQGLYNGTYNGLGSLGSGIVAFLMFENRDAKEQGRRFVQFFAMMTGCTMAAFLFSVLLSVLHRKNSKFK